MSAIVPTSVDRSDQSFSANSPSAGRVAPFSEMTGRVAPPAAGDDFELEHAVRFPARSSKIANPSRRTMILLRLSPIVDLLRRRNRSFLHIVPHRIIRPAELPPGVKRIRMQR